MSTKIGLILEGLSHLNESMTIKDNPNKKHSLGLNKGDISISFNADNYLRCNGSYDLSGSLDFIMMDLIGNAFSDKGSSVILTEERFLECVQGEKLIPLKEGDTVHNKNEREKIMNDAIKAIGADRLINTGNKEEFTFSTYASTTMDFDVLEPANIRNTIKEKLKAFLNSKNIIYKEELHGVNSNTLTIF